MKTDFLLSGCCARAALAVLFLTVMGGCATAPVTEPEPEEAPEPIEQKAEEKAPRPEPLPRETVYFGYNQYELTSRTREALKFYVEKLLAQPDVKITIDGHCDERGSDAYNLDLGWKRAYSVRDYLKRLGVDDGRIFPNSYGRARPVVPGSGETVWSKNRRVELAEKK